MHLKCCVRMLARRNDPPGAVILSPSAIKRKQTGSLPPSARISNVCAAPRSRRVPSAAPCLTPAPDTSVPRGTL